MPRLEVISIHSPRMGRDLNYKIVYPVTIQFQSTLPAWGETLCNRYNVCGEEISIHSPRMGRDNIGMGVTNAITDFNPLSPHGERLIGTCHVCNIVYFNPLSPHGERRRLFTRFQSYISISIHSPRMGRDSSSYPDVICNCISIHSPRMGRDAIMQHCRRKCEDFNPLSPHGERPCCYPHSPLIAKISIHSPRMGRDMGVM